ARAAHAPARASAPAFRYAGLDEAGTQEALDYLSQQGLLHASGGHYTWTSETSPASHVSLRSISWDNFVIVDVAAGKTLAELDFRSTHTMLHEQAIYQHDAAQYQVERLDYENHKAYVRRVEPDYFTTALTHSRVTILDAAGEREPGCDTRSAEEAAAGASSPRSLFGHGDIKVVETVTGYKKIKFFTHENAGYGDVRLPDLEMHTTGFWWTLGGRLPARWSRALLVDALRGAGAALETVASIALMCEPRDIGRTLGDAEEPDEDGADAGGAPPGLSFRPTLFLYDALPGGVGLARRIYERTEELMDRAA